MNYTEIAIYLKEQFNQKSKLSQLSPQSIEASQQNGIAVFS